MKKLLLASCAICIIILFQACRNTNQNQLITTDRAAGEEDEGYDNPGTRDSLEFEKTKDPALGYIPFDRLYRAVNVTEKEKRRRRQLRMTSLSWTERGPISDSIGPSDNNRRAGLNSTSGYTTSILIDTLNDPSGNTVLFGSTTGGIWKCTNFLAPAPNWHPVNDYYETLNVGSICQDPVHPNIMYFASGTDYYPSATIYGAGIWKSIDAGNTWSKLSNTGTLNRAMKIVCDAAGNVYTAQRAAAVPIAQPFGLLRSNDGGTTWTNITPGDLTSDASCTDIEFSAGGRMQASFGFQGTFINHRYTDAPSTVTPSAGWSSSTGIISTGTPALWRTNIACQGNILYAVTVNSSGNAQACYKSIDNGANWTTQNTAPYPTAILNGQGEYDVTLSINPSNSSEFILGGLDAYKSLDDGKTDTMRLTHWTGNVPPYVHADHHFMQWWMVGSESRIVIGCDGGVFLSRDGGQTFSDRNKNLSVKQFYSCAIHPDPGSPYLLAGAQDNGTHSLRDAGLGNSTEVTGGDGAFVHINQQNPQIQFGAYVFNSYRRSNDGGNTWQYFDFSSTGIFINPFDCDDGQNILYGSYGSNAMLRWSDANTIGGALSTVSIPQLAGSTTAVKMSPYTPNRIFLGSNSGKIVRLENANTVTTGTVAANATLISGPSFPGAYLNCINIGSSDQFLVAVFTNFGVENVWYSSDGGGSWTGIDGNLPDMPVRWALFDPQDNNKLYIATSAGIYHTDAVNGASTSWDPETSFPTVRTDMLQLRLSDNTLVAATYGRGLYTTVIPNSPEIRFTAPAVTYTESTAASLGCRNYKDYSIPVAITKAPTGDAIATFDVLAGNSAIPGSDFEYTTNGDFNNPSHQQIFSNGSTALKNITIRIYDDNEIEAPESFTIAYTLSGSSNAITGPSNRFSVTINSNDSDPLTEGTFSGIIGIGDNTTSNSQPFRGQFSDAKTQCLYTRTELQAMGMRAGDTITSLSFFVVSKGSSGAFNNFTLKMKNSSSQNLSLNDYFESGTTIVYGPLNYSTVAGTNKFILNGPFIWNGDSSLLVEVCFHNPVALGANDVVRSSVTTGTLSVWDRNNGVVGCDLPFPNFNLFGTTALRPDLGIEVNKVGNPVATQLNTLQSNYLGNNNDLYYFSATGQVLARVHNLDPFNYGCTEVKIDRAGTGVTPFWNNNASNSLMNKSIRISPSVNHITGQYEITIYYTAAEKQGWEAATGQSWNNIQLVKTEGAISQVTPSNPNGAGNVQIVEPIRGILGNNYSLTYTFNTGFSGFGAGIPGQVPLPVTLLNFNGQLQNKVALLNWSTAFEQNSKDFDIEKSSDGANYEKIGSVRAAGNSADKRQYIFSDIHPFAINYYRLRMNDNDGRYKLSQVVLIRVQNASQNLWVLNNPFNEYLDIRFAKEAKHVKLQLFNATGGLVREQMLSGATDHYKWLMGETVPRGNYFLLANVDGSSFRFKVIKQ